MTVTTITFDETDKAAIEKIRRHLEESDTIRRGPVSKREAVCWAVRMAASSVKEAKRG